MSLIEQNQIGFALSAQGDERISAINPSNGETLPGRFSVATPTEADKALQIAQTAWKTYRNCTGKQKATFLRSIAEELEASGDALIQRAVQESGLPEGRITGERGRTCGQLRLFAQLLDEGSWVEAVIDPAMPQRQPLPRPDIRKMLVAMGPVVVFTASNFPLAFSTAGGDTAAALAAGCPVVVKAHESHPGTNALVAAAILNAARKTGMPEGVFSTLYGRGNDLGKWLVEHPMTKAVAFTGSFRGGKALFDLAAKRPEPIPVFAEMGSVNPIFVLPEIMAAQTTPLAQQLAASVNLGAGQFCTNPGLIICLENEYTPAFETALRSAFAQHPAATMLNKSIYENYSQSSASSIREKGVKALVGEDNNAKPFLARPLLAKVQEKDFLKNPRLQEEIFGPFSLLVLCKSPRGMQKVASILQGQLTASLMGTDKDLRASRPLGELLQEKVGRLIYNNVPTGVEVGHAMQHGGPYPASTDARFTSVGTGAIRRFVRPLAFQNCPQRLLPPELRDSNPLRIWRMVDGLYSKKKVNHA